MSNKLPQGWKKVKISDVSEVVSGGTPSTKNEAFYNGEIGWITPKDLSGYTKKYIKNGARNITLLGLEKSSAKLLPKGTVLLSSRAPIGYLAIAEGDLSTNQGFKNLVCNKDKLDNIFIYYYLKSKKDDLEQIASGSTFKEVSGNTLKNFEIKIPSDINEQKRIADILTAFDDKIEINNQINQTLEEMASALFKEWFENFNFPNNQGKPYKDSGGEMKPSELGEIPIDWEVGNAEQLILFNPTTTLKKGIVSKYVDMKSLSTNSMTIEGVINREFKGTGTKFINNDTLLSRITPCLENGKIGYVDFLKNDEVAWGSTEYIICRGQKKYLSEFTYLFCRYKPFYNYAIANMNGSSGRQRVPANVLKIFRMAKAKNDDIYKKFSNIVKPIFDQIQQNQQQNQILKQQRDALLPKLISGEIRV